MTITNTGVGISGANVGTITYTMNNIASYALGTTFDDNATRDIFDPNTAGTNANTAPYLGNYPARGELQGRARQPGASSSNKRSPRGSTVPGNSRPSRRAPPPRPLRHSINYWTLNFTQGLNANIDDVVVPGTKGPPSSPVRSPIRIRRPRRPCPSASGPVSSWPRITRSARSARTRGGSTPRSSATTTSPSSGVKNPTDNTDIFLTYSDDGGRTWSDSGSGQRRRLARRRLHRVE